MRLAALAFALVPTVVTAASVTCAEDRRTNAFFCFDPAEIREADGIRIAPLYTGGPAQIDRTPYTIAANCATGVLHLKDRKGVSFGGAGPGQGTRQSRDLLQFFCAATVPKPRPKR